jgi:phosphatidyl-myo-inositol alpha-mannosyltransferase
MRIIQVSAYGLGRPGGVQSHVRDLSRALRARGHAVRCISPDAGGAVPPGSARDFEELGRQRTISLGGTKFELSHVPRAALVAVAAEIGAWQPDLLHVHGLWVPMLPWQLFSTLKAARVVTFHDTTAPGLTGTILRSLFRPLGKVIANRVDAAIAVSQAPMEHLGPAAARRPITIMPPAVDLSDFLTVRKRPVSGPPMILHWGRLDPRKNLSTLLNAARLIWRGETDWPAGAARPCFVIAGDGTDADLVRRAAEELGPEAIRRLPSPDRHTLVSLLEQARLCVFPSGYGESFGIVLSEALASGTPVLAGDNAGFRGLLGKDGSGFLFDPLDPRLLASRIAALIGDPDGLQARAAWGMTHARQFDISNHVEGFENLYAAAIASYRRSNDEGSGYQV